MKSEPDLEVQAQRLFSWIFWTTLVFLLVFVVYPLSAGPVVYIIDYFHHGIFKVRFLGGRLPRVLQIYQFVYYPLLLTMSQSHALKSLFESYLSLWVDLGRPC